MIPLSVPPQNRIFWAGVTVCAALHFLFYPPVYAFIDEAAYLAMSYVLRQGTFFADQTSVPFPSWILVNGQRIHDYPPGMSFLLLPFTVFGWHAVFLAGLLAHVVGAVYFRRLLRYFGMENPFLSWLYLFYPAFIFYSRTIMSDVPAAALFLAGVYFYFVEKAGRTGLFFGLSLVFRPTGIVFILPFAAFFLLRRLAGQDWKKIAAFSGAFLPFAAFIAGYRAIFYGIPFFSDYSPGLAGIPFFSSQYLFKNIQHYFFSFLICWPLMIFAPFTAVKTRRPEMLLSIAAGLTFFGFYFFYDYFASPLETVVFGNRFLFPAAALALLMYAEALDRFLKHIPQAFYFLFALFCCAAAALIHWKHQQALKPQAAMKEAVYRATQDGSALIYDQFSAELMQEAWGRRKYINWKDSSRSLPEYLNTADYEKGVYLIRRGHPGNLNLSWVSASEMQIPERLNASLETREGELEIYRLKPR